MAEIMTNDATIVDSKRSPVTNGKTQLSDAFREHFSGDASFVDKVKNFSRAKPWASAALAGVAGIAILNSLRGRKH